GLYMGQRLLTTSTINNAAKNESQQTQIETNGKASEENRKSIHTITVSIKGMKDSISASTAAQTKVVDSIEALEEKNVTRVEDENKALKRKVERLERGR
ncbi:unnamed protein product, partial [marine sediment metagenome]